MVLKIISNHIKNSPFSTNYKLLNKSLRNIGKIRNSNYQSMNIDEINKIYQETKQTLNNPDIMKGESDQEKNIIIELDRELEKVIREYKKNIKNHYKNTHWKDKLAKIDDDFRMF